MELHPPEIVFFVMAGIFCVSWWVWQWTYTKKERELDIAKQRIEALIDTNECLKGDVMFCSKVVERMRARVQWLEQQLDSKNKGKPPIV